MDTYDFVLYTNSIFGFHQTFYNELIKIVLNWDDIIVKWLSVVCGD